MKDLTHGNEAKLILLFSLPMLLGNVFQQFYNMVDSIVVGQFVGKQALAAVGQSFPVIFVFVALVTGFGMASNILVAQYYGAKKFDRLQAVVDTSLAFTVVFSLAVTALGILGAPVILRLMRTPGDVLPGAVLYLRIIFAGTIASFAYNTFSAIQRGLGDSRTPLYALIISTLVNVALDLAFVVFFGWGVAGVAIATVIAQVVSVSWTALYLAKKDTVFKLDVTHIRFDRAIFREIVRLGLPSGIQQGLVGAGLMTLTGVVNQFGTNPAAAFSVAGKLDSFAVMPAMSMSLAIASFTGQNLGAGRKDRVHRGLAYALSIALAVSGTIAAILYFRGDWFIRLFSGDREVIRIGTEYFKIVAFAYVAQTVMFCFSGVLRGAGSMVFTMLMTLMSMWIVRVPLALVFSRYWGTSGIWWSVVCGFAVGMTGTILYYAFGNWGKRALVMPLAD